jgi:hypothetical protein
LYINISISIFIFYGHPYYILVRILSETLFFLICEVFVAINGVMACFELLMRFLAISHVLQIYSKLHCSMMDYYSTTFHSHLSILNKEASVGIMLPIKL